MFDIYYLGDNQPLSEKFPFATKIDDPECDIIPNTKMYWLVDSQIEILDYDLFNFRPNDYDMEYEHIWKRNSQNYGGVRLLPRQASSGVKEINKVVCKKIFEILNTKTPGKYFSKTPYATHVWCVDPEYKLDRNIDWAPSNFEPDFIHSFHLRGQLEHKYPAEEGGIKLYPRDWKSASVKYHKFLDASVKYPILYVNDPEDYSQRDIYNDEYVWLVDKEYCINEKSFDWVPNPFEQEYIHSFRMPNQLQEKSWSFKHDTDNKLLGGIRLVPKNWKKSFDLIPNGIIIHKDCPVEDETYDVFYIDSEDFSAEEYSELADRAKTEWFWVVDREYDFNGRLQYIPREHELDYIHVFKVPGHLEERYPIDIIEPWDIRCGGVRLLNKKFDMTKHKYQENICPVKYDIFYSTDLDNYEIFAKKSKTKMFWLIDEEHVLNNDFTFIPHKYDQKYIHVFKVPNQLEHKYDTNITNTSDNRCGGVKLVPVKYNVNDIKFSGPIKNTNKTYPIIYVDNINDVKNIVEDCWLVDKEYKINDKINWIPPDFQKNNIHIFHVKNQLLHKYPEESGGVKWIPMSWDGKVVIHKIPLDIGKSYPVYFVNNPSDFSQVTEDCWLVDKEYEIDPNITILPWGSWNDKWKADAERKLIHNYHVKGQLAHKYPEAMGGVYWVPKDHIDAEVKIHEEPLQVDRTFPVYFVNNPSDFSQVTEDCWLVDEEYELDPNITYLPWGSWNDKWQADAERKLIHVYHVKDQLRHKYPEAMGGVYWVPKDYANAEVKIHEEPLQIDRTFPVYFVQDPTDFSQVTEDCWLVDKEYEIDPNITYLPWGSWNDKWQADAERKLIHVYHVKGQLAHKYPEAMGGVYWVPKDYANAEVKIHSEELALKKTYPMHLVDDPTVITDVSEDCWVLDKDYIIDKSDLPSPWNFQSESNMIHVFHVKGQLSHKYPEAMGGVYWIPSNWNGDFKIHDDIITPDPKLFTLLSENTNTNISSSIKSVFEIYANEDEGYEKCTSEMFWVIDNGIEIDPEFSFEFVPDVWDKDKIHMWQKINPVTGRQYDYGGIKLYPKIKPEGKSRPKYHKEKSCTEKRYPVLYLQSNIDYIEQLVEFEESIDTNMYWVVDPFVSVAENFNFDYYPTSWDCNYVHTFVDYKDEFNSVRLFPKGTFINDTDFYEDDYMFNRFDNIKQINSIPCAEKSSWPVSYFSNDTFTVAQLNNIKQIAIESNKRYFWTVDPEVTPKDDLFEIEYDLETGMHTNNVNVFQMMGNKNDIVKYAGVRLWPADLDVSELTDEKLKTYDHDMFKYIEMPGGTLKIYPMYELITTVDVIEQLIEIEKEVDDEMYWVVDPGVKRGTPNKWTHEDYYVTSWDKNYIHVFKNTLGEYRGMRLVPKGTFSEDKAKTLGPEDYDNNSFENIKEVDQVASALHSYPVIKFSECDVKKFKEQVLKYKEEGHTYVWTVDQDVEVIQDVLERSYIPSLDRLNLVHAWQRLNPLTDNIHSYGGLRLWPTFINYEEISSDQIRMNKIKNLQYVRKKGSKYLPFEIVFLSYHELYAETAYERLSQRFPVKWIRDVEGIFAAHKQAAAAVKSTMFWVVDADAVIDEDFDFSYIPDVYDQDVVHVWKSKNPITGDDYGYGGIKLFNTAQVNNANNWGLDFTTGLSNRFKVMPIVASTTAFNTDAYSTWRSSFRESVKLTINGDGESLDRLEGWLNPVPNADFRDEAILGAQMGKAHAEKFKQKPLMLARINDYEWLQELYENTIKNMG